MNRKEQTEAFALKALIFIVGLGLLIFFISLC